MELGEGFKLIRGCKYPYKINEAGEVFYYNKKKGWVAVKVENLSDNRYVRLRYEGIKNTSPVAVYRLLAEAFIKRPARNKIYQIRFRDGNKLNHSLDNLYWEEVKQLTGKIYALIVNGKEVCISGSLSDFLRNANYNTGLLLRLINKEMLIKGVSVYVGTREDNPVDQ